MLVILCDEIERQQRNGLVDYAQNVKHRNKGDAKLSNVDVNKLFGWENFNVRRKKTKEQFEKRELGGDTSGVERDIKFLTSMTTRKEEAMLDEDYLEKYYGSFLRSYDKGGLILVSMKWFNVDAKVVRSVSSVITPEKLEKSYEVIHGER